PMIALPAQADVQIIALAEAPAIPFEVFAEIKLRPLAGDRAARRLFVAQFELDLLRTDGPLFLAELCAEEARHRTEVAAGANDQRRGDLTVDQPAPTLAFPALALHGFPRFAEPQAGAAALEQIVVEFAAPDAVAHYFVVVHGCARLLAHAGDERIDGLEHST